jgi:hypothetical protein
LYRGIDYGTNILLLSQTKEQTLTQ